MKKSHTTEQFIEDILCRGVHPDGRYNYRMVEYKGNNNKVDIYCNNCQKSFTQTPSSHKQGCGCPSCHNKTSNIYYLKETLTIEEEPIEVGGVIQCRCTYCKEYFIPTRFQLYHRIDALLGKCRGEHRLYCSNECKNLCPIYYKSIYPEGNKAEIYRKDQPELRRLTLERDNYTCQICGSSENLHCHHITGVEINPVESADIDNCITLCYTCHSRVHSGSQCEVRRQKCVV